VSAALTARGLLQPARACYGGALLIAPARVIGLATGRPASRRACTMARVLGARHLLQAAATMAAASSAESLGLGAVVDLAHAASMAGLAVADRRVRRLTLSDVMIETVFATVGLSQVTHPPFGDFR
jgi:hypothetical protein